MSAGDRTEGLPLAGIRVLDLTRVLAGPCCTMLLADLGADVVKVEAPGTGGETRSWGPPFAGRESTCFFAINRNRRSIALDPHFTTNADRVADRGALVSIPAARFAGQPVGVRLERLRRARVPAGPIRTLDAALADPVVAARGMLAAAAHPSAGPLTMAGVPRCSDAAQTAIRRPPPRLGEHTEGILTGLGYDGQAVARLRAAGVVA